MSSIRTAGLLSYASYIAQAMKDATCVLNCSLSEGQCGAILEAMTMGTLVLARAIEGNACVIEHMHTGLLFATPEVWYLSQPCACPYFSFSFVRTSLFPSLDIP